MVFDTSAEQEIRDFFKQKGIKYFDNSSSFKQLDFIIIDINGQPAFHFDVKEKRQKYNLNNWPKFAPESDLFILDDLAVRKCLAYGPKSGILIRDNIRKKYNFVSIVDLALMPRARVNRPIHRNQHEEKGKWLINLRNGKEFQLLDEAYNHFHLYLQELNSVLLDTISCYGNYIGEDIQVGGIVRTPSHWETDVKNTR